jgi:hypothetical protein
MPVGGNYCPANCRPPQDKGMPVLNTESTADDFDFFVGRWSVRHRRLKERLAASAQWEQFGGTSEMHKLMDGQGNIDDNVIELPAGRYRAVSLRCSMRRRSSGRSGGWTDAIHTASNRPFAGASARVPVPSMGTTCSRASPSACASCGPISPRPPAAGSRRSRPMAARPGRPTGSWTSRGCHKNPRAGRYSVTLRRPALERTR